MTAPVADASLYADLSGLAALKREARAADSNALREVARQFESIFAKMMLSSMRTASFGDPLLGSDQHDFYQSLLDDQLSLELTKGRGLGLADLLVQQLTRSGLVAGSETAQTEGAQSPAGSARGASTTSQVTRASTTAVADTRESFVRELWPCAQEAARELGVDPRHLLAQAALETGWGQHVPCDAQGKPSFNLFGIKAGERWTGATVTVPTVEFEGGFPVRRHERFRAYDSIEHSFRDYVALLRENPRYAEALNTGSDTKAFADALQRGGYATDPAYAQKVAAIAQNLSESFTALKSDDERPISPKLGTL
ncbi:MAG: flagellar assembly peptidoglycan hydrolase FlgJ [Steroidobacteraceae bacterium]|nr:flagellar assembly peptidoglycan hydrolase FlgJ [Steroidobacteraceae bacterium]